MNGDSVHVLLIEDNPGDARLIAEMLRELREPAFALHCAERLSAGRQALQENQVDLILLDLSLPDSRGLDTMTRMQEAAGDIPIVVLTGLADEELAVRAVRQGAQDYLIKGEVQSDLLGRALRYAMERKRAEQALRQSEEHFRTAFDDAPIGMALVERDGRLLRVNKALCDMLSRSEAELTALRLDDVTHPDDLQHGTRLPELLFAGEIPSFKLSKRYLRPCQQVVWGILTMTVIRGGGPEPLRGLAMLEDVTERRLTEEQLRLSQRLEAVGQLAGGVAHDFNNLLTVILGNSELLLETLDAEDPARQDVEAIAKAADRAASLTRQLLAFSRRQVLSPKVLDLNASVAETQKMLRRLIGENVELATDLHPELGQVRADPGQIEQVIVNLALNARDAMPDGGQLTIETANIDLDASYADLHEPMLPGRYVLLAVSDTGVGMDEETRARVFEPFFTTKDKGKGTGLGLATVYGIVKQSGGYIWAYSEPAQGATFKVFLPRVDQELESADAGSQAGERALGSETVLVVEDEDGVRTLASRSLRQSGYDVLEAGDGMEALRVEEAHGGPIQILVTDVIMPQMSGPELAERLTPLHPEMKILYLSGYADKAIARHGVLEPGTHFLQKPFSANRLVHKVRQVLDGSGDDRAL